MADFFISYNSADKSWAEWIAWTLEAADYTTKLQAWDFGPASNFILDMQKASEECPRLIAALSPDYLAAIYTQPEWAAYFARDPTGEKGIFLPVRVRDCELEGMLAQVVYIDLVGLDEHDAENVLLKGLKPGRAKPEAKPEYPVGAAQPDTVKPAFPGGLPPVWNVPHRRNLNFTGREGLLADLRERLESSGHAAVTQAIAGLGGVGKTELATEYAYRHAGDYDIVWWVRSEEPARLASDYAALAGPLQLPGRDEADQPAVCKEVKARLGRETGWLLVFDNVPAPESVRRYLPQGGAGHIIITSRHPTWGTVAEPMAVQVFEEKESVKFLLERSRQSDAEAARELARELGDLPLALEQAGAYVEETGISLADYLALCRERRAEVLELGKPSTDYPFTVATTWQLAFEGASEESPAAAALLNLCAFLAPDDIPKDLITGGAEFLPDPLSEAAADPLKFNESVAGLRRYSLIEVTDDAISVHRLVQVVVRDRLDGDARKEWAAAAVELLNGAFPYEQDDLATWPLSSRLLPHALAAAGHAEADEVAGKATGRLLNESAVYLWGRAEFSEARAVLERALMIAESAYGPSHPTVATRLSNLGIVLRELGDLGGARERIERALAIDEEAYGPDHPNVAIRLNNLGTALQALGDWQGAKGRLERALAIDEAAYGPDHPDVAMCLSNLGLALHSLGDLRGAKGRLERTLAINEATYGPDHPRVAICLTNLGAVLRDSGDLEGARKCFERALRIFLKFLGELHPKTKLVRKRLEALGDGPFTTKDG